MINAGTLRTNESSENACGREILLYKDLDLKDHKENILNYNNICKTTVNLVLCFLTLYG